MHNTSLALHTELIRSLPYGHVQAIKLEFTKSSIDENGKTASSTISRTIEACFLGNKHGEDKYCITCIEADFTNFRQPDHLVRLKLLIMEVFDVIVLSTDQNGRILRIDNFGYLKEQWNELRKEIMQDHDKEEHLQLVFNMDLLMQNEITVIAYLQLPANYGLYFNGCRTINVNKKRHTHSTLFGEELSNKSVDEALECSVTHNTFQQLVEFTILPADNKAYKNYKGFCVYLDGMLDTYHKEIKTEFFTLNYSAKWVGLKKSFLQ